MAVAFPGKEILIGETGWPSEGRMRDGALPSRTNQARVVSEILGLAKANKFRVNLIEAYDQPWKRRLEGTVGGCWGLFDSVRRGLKYPPGQPISNFPYWKWYMGAGMGLSVLVFARWRRSRCAGDRGTPRLTSAWLGVAISATTAEACSGSGADKMYYESYGTRRLAALGRAAARRHPVADLLRPGHGDRPQPSDLPRSARSARGSQNGPSSPRCSARRSR
ncbi:hypothetical protein ACU4GH_38580 [Bradyrhizobium betae]